MRILFCSIRNPSHFAPLVPFIEACMRRGHDVAVAAPSDLAERVVKTGAAFFPFGHPGDAGLSPLWARMHAVSQKDQNGFVIREIFAKACAAAALPGLLETLQQWNPAIVLRESQEYASVVATEKLGIPRARVSIMQRTVEREGVELAAAAVDAHRVAMGLSSDPTGARMLLEPSLSLFPASFDPPGAGQAVPARFRPATGQSKPLPAWWRNAELPLVYVTLGTVTGGMAPLRDAYRRVLDAVGPLPIRVLLTIGSDLPLEALGELPATVHVERFVPQNDVLSHAAAVLCHGGSGTVIGTLSAGLPMVIMPMFADQPQNAARVSELGVGLGLSPAGCTAEDLRQAVSRVLTESAFRIAAQRLAAEVAALPPVDDAALEIERLAQGRL